MSGSLCYNGFLTSVLGLSQKHMLYEHSLTHIEDRSDEWRVRRVQLCYLLNMPFTTLNSSSTKETIFSLNSQLQDGQSNYYWSTRASSELQEENTQRIRSLSIFQTIQVSDSKGRTVSGSEVYLCLSQFQKSAFSPFTLFRRSRKVFAVLKRKQASQILT